MPNVAKRKEPGEGVLRALYSFALYVLSPFTLYHLISRGFRVHEYFRRWDERYATYGSQPRRPCVWLHAVSVGEVNAAAPLVNVLLRQRPDIRWVITTITPTGSERVRALWGERVEHVYLPYDLPGSTARFLQHFQPSLGLIMETELWPNLLFGLRDARIPAYIVNGRLSQRSLRGYRFLRALLGRALRTLRAVLAQSEGDAERFAQLGAVQPRVTGNLKFDIAPTADAAQFAREVGARIGGRPCWIAASTHPEEEAPVLEMHRLLNPLVAPLDTKVAQLALQPRGNWQAELDSGAVIELGHGMPRDLAARLTQFVGTVKEVAARHQRGVDAVEAADLRHAGGYALRLRGVSTVRPDAQPAVKR